MKAPKNASSDNEDVIQAGFLSTGPVIIYAWQQQYTETLAEQLTSYGVIGGVVSYQGGMNADTRQCAKGKFMSGKARVIVDIVAFDLGINKADIPRTLCAGNWQSRTRWKEINCLSTGSFQ